MFLVNSRQRLVLATQLRVPLLPKLRGYFAEFLGKSYLDPLNIFNLPTCVGLGYRYLLFVVVRAFLGSMTSAGSVP